MRTFNTVYDEFIMTLIIKILSKIGVMIRHTIGRMNVLTTENRTRTIMVSKMAAIIVMFVLII